MIKVEQMTLIKQEEIAEDIFEIVLEGSLVAEMNQPGQFVNIKVAEGDTPLLRRPISICEINHEEKRFTMLYRAEGQGTKILSQRKVGDKVDILGPLGTGFPVDAAKEGSTAILVGGGIGVPPLYELSKQLVAKGVTVIHVLGFQTKSAVFYEEEFSKLGKTFIATVDGTHGTKGFVTDIIEKEGIAFDVLYTCGPTPMLRALEAKYGHKEMYLSVEERMACGIGACFACVCRKKDDPTGYTYKKVCTDGPVFQAGEVIL